MHLCPFWHNHFSLIDFFLLWAKQFTIFQQHLSSQNIWRNPNQWTFSMKDKLIIFQWHKQIKSGLPCILRPPKHSLRVCVCLWIDETSINKSSKWVPPCRFLDLFRKCLSSTMGVNFLHQRQFCCLATNDSAYIEFLCWLCTNFPNKLLTAANEQPKIAWRRRRRRALIEFMSALV